MMDYIRDKFVVKVVSHYELDSVLRYLSNYNNYNYYKSMNFRNHKMPLYVYIHDRNIGCLDYEHKQFINYTTYDYKEFSRKFINAPNPFNSQNYDYDYAIKSFTPLNSQRLGVGVGTGTLTDIIKSTASVISTANETKLKHPKIDLIKTNNLIQLKYE